MRTLAAALTLAASVAFATSAVAQDEVERGHVVYHNWCTPCHAPVTGSERLAGTSALQLKYKGSEPAVLEQRTDLNAATVDFYVRHGFNAMPFFRKTEIGDADLRALEAYLMRKARK